MRQKIRIGPIGNANPVTCSAHRSIPPEVLILPIFETNLRPKLYRFSAGFSIARAFHDTFSLDPCAPLKQSTVSSGQKCYFILARFIFERRIKNREYKCNIISFNSHLHFSNFSSSQYSAAGFDELPNISDWNGSISRDSNKFLSFSKPFSISSAPTKGFAKYIFHIPLSK